MDQLTVFERALLEKFEALATASDSALNASKNTSERLQELSGAMHRRLEQIEEKQREIESFQQKLLTALNEQSEHTEDLVSQVNALLNEQHK